MCQIQHTFILVSAVVEACVRPHNLLWNTTKPLLILWYLYTLWIIHIHRITGLWVYPFFPYLPFELLAPEIVLIPLITPVMFIAKAISQFIEKCALAVRVIDLSNLLNISIIL